MGGSVREVDKHPHSSVKQPGQSTSNFLWSDWSIAVVITGKCSEPCNTPVWKCVLCARESFPSSSIFIHIFNHVFLTVCLCIYSCINMFDFCLCTLPWMGSFVLLFCICHLRLYIKCHCLSICVYITIGECRYSVFGVCTLVLLPSCSVCWMCASQLLKGGSSAVSPLPASLWSIPLPSLALPL